MLKSIWRFFFPVRDKHGEVAPPPPLRINRMKSVLRGINQMSLTTSVPNIHFGSLREDAQKIGSDMRKAITPIERCE